MVLYDFYNLLTDNSIVKPSFAEVYNFTSGSHGKVFFDFKDFEAAVNISEDNLTTGRPSRVCIWTSLWQQPEDEDFRIWFDLNYETLTCVLFYLQIFKWYSELNSLTKEKMLEGIKNLS